MSCKDIVFYLVCVTAWFVLLPLLVVGGTITLVGYALFSELRENFLGRRAKVLDKAAAREMARRLCLGN